MALDPRIEAIRDQYGLAKDDFWQIPQNKQWVCKHAALEVVAVKANVGWSLPTVVQADTAGGIAVLVVSGTLGDRTEWSTGEASPKNNKNAYPWAMAEKRAKDRVILKLVGLHGLVYSEAEADAFDSSPAQGQGPAFTAPQPKAASRELHQAMLDKVIEAGRKGRAALREYWTSEEFIAGWEVMPEDWQKILTEEKEAFLASYAKPTGRIDPNTSLDQQFAATVAN